MAIPDFQSLMLPLMRMLAGGREYSVQETVDLLALQYQLTEEEKSQLLPSGRSPIFYNRIAWAKAHLKRAGLIERPRRGYYKISEMGEKVLESSPAVINLRFLKQFPAYVAIRERD